MYKNVPFRFVCTFVNCRTLFKRLKEKRLRNYRKVFLTKNNVCTWKKNEWKKGYATHAAFGDDGPKMYLSHGRGCCLIVKIIKL